MLGNEHEDWTTFEDLPDEVIECILDKVSAYQDSISCALVCRRWRHAINRYPATLDELCLRMKPLLVEAPYRIPVIHMHNYLTIIMQLTKLISTTISGKDVSRKRDISIRKALINFNVQWRKCEAETTQIPPRYSHSACVVGNAMYVFGGCTSSFTTFNDLLRLDLATRTWSRPAPERDTANESYGYPRPKAGASIVADEKDNRLIIFGGWKPEPSPTFRDWSVLGELHIATLIRDGSRVSWTFSMPTCQAPPLAGHGATVHGRTMVIYGGVTIGARYPCLSSTEVWCFDLDTYDWYQPEIKFPQPSARYQHSQMKIDDQHLIILGGCGGPNQLYNDCWLLTMPPKGSWHWRMLEVENQDYRAPQLWCYPACKIGDLAVVVSQLSANIATSSSPIVPFNLTVAELPDVSRSRPLPLDLDKNVNGRRGCLSRSPPKSVRPGPAGLAAFRDNPVQAQQQMRRPIPRPPAAAPMWPRAALYVLDVSQALTHGLVRWVRPPKDFPQNSLKNIEQKMLYTLVAGRAELILFGGIRKDPRGVGNADQASRDSLATSAVHFLQAPF